MIVINGFNNQAFEKFKPIKSGKHRIIQNMTNPKTQKGTKLTPLPRKLTIKPYFEVFFKKRNHDKDELDEES